MTALANPRPRARQGRKRGRGRAACTVMSCGRVVRGRGLCSMHYMREYRLGTFAFAAVEDPTGCSVEDCAGAHQSQGYCNLHYQRWLKTGDPLLTLNDLRPTRPTVCTIDGCERPVCARDWCSRHYSRWQRHGDPMVGPNKWGQGNVNSSGYVQIGAKGHPLAVGAKQNALQHRVRLYDVIGPGPHGCHWCGTLIAWVPTEHIPTRLVVDHVDEDRANNALSNLVPACQTCNFSRKHFGNARPIGV